MKSGWTVENMRKLLEEQRRDVGPNETSKLIMEVLTKKSWTPAYVQPIADALGPMIEEISDGDEPWQVLAEFAGDLACGLKDLNLRKKERFNRP